MHDIWEEVHIPTIPPRLPPAVKGVVKEPAVGHATEPAKVGAKVTVKVGAKIPAKVAAEEPARVRLTDHG